MILGRGARSAEKRFKSLTRLLIEKLKEAIVSGKLAPGEPLAEAQLAASLKVGPAALREALRALEVEGYVTFRPDTAVVVSKPSREEIEDYYAIAGALDWNMGLPLDAVVMAVGTSAAIGIVFGFFPARRAARMDPINALRHE